MNAAWLRGIRDLFDWVLGDRDVSPLRGRTLAEPPLQELDLEDEAAEEISRQDRIRGNRSISPPKYNEGVQAAIHWLRGETTAIPIQPYEASSHDVNLTP